MGVASVDGKLTHEVEAHGCGRLATLERVDCREEGDVLVVPAKRRRSPRPAVTSRAYRSDTHTPLPRLHPVWYCRYSNLHLDRSHEDIMISRRIVG